MNLYDTRGALVALGCFAATGCSASGNLSGASTSAVATSGTLGLGTSTSSATASTSGRATAAASTGASSTGTTPTTTRSTSSSTSGAVTADGGTCPAQAGALILYAIPPPAPLDWSTPSTLLNAMLASTLAGNTLVSSGSAVLPHAIGHVNLELDCGAASIPLTGQTGGGNELLSSADGAGALFRLFPGSLNELTDPIGDNVDTVADIMARQASGHLTRIKFLVNQQMCARLKDFHDQYSARMAYLNYDGLDRARRFEGAGCAIYGDAFVDVGGLLRRSLFTPAWARTVFVGSARFANTLGTNPYYLYGSNLVARDAQGVDWLWPAGVNIPASTLSPILPTSGVLDAWTGPEDAPFALPGVTLPGRLASQVPFTLYDPELMAEWAEQVWAQASAQGPAAALGATWTADTVQAVHEVTYDAHCVLPQTLAYTQDNPDLFLDSDAP